jgi:hypothetical protein
VLHICITSCAFANSSTLYDYTIRLFGLIMNVQVLMQMEVTHKTRELYVVLVQVTKLVVILQT